MTLVLTPPTPWEWKFTFILYFFFFDVFPYTSLIFRAFCGGPWGAAGFGLLRFITGMGGIGCFMVSFVLVVEHVGFKLTALFGVAIEIPFALGQAVLGLEAFVFRDWRVLQIVSHLPLLGEV